MVYSDRLGLMKQVNMYEAKTHFSLLVAEALRGEDVVVARNGKPLVRLVPVKARKPSDAFGMDRGKVWIAPDFDEPLEEFEEYV
jgi:prevent-host-death family protein